MMHYNAKVVHFGAVCQLKYRMYLKIIQTKIVQNLISYKNLNGRMPLPPPEVVKGSIEDLLFLKLCTGMGKYYFHFGAEHCQKYQLYREVLSSKVGQN